MFYRLLHSAVDTEVTEFGSMELAIEWIAEHGYDWPNCTLIEFFGETVIGRTFNGFELEEMHDAKSLPTSDSK